MKNSVHMHYETEGGASYLVVELDEGTQPIPYQIGMLGNNSFEHLLDLKIYREDGISYIRYNVTSKMTFSQVINRQKMTKDEFITLLNGLLDCYRELPEYQLPTSGIMLDDEHIFLKSGSFVPYLVFLPIYSESNGIDDLRDFARKLIMESRIESTQDNFIQRVLDLLNSSSSADRLQTQLQSLRRETAGNQQTEVRHNFQPVSQQKLPRASASVSVPPAAQIRTEPATRPEPQRPDESAKRVEKGAVPKHKKTPVSPQKPAQKKSDDAAKGRIIMLAMNAVLLLLTALLFSRGFFYQEDQSINLPYIGGVLLLFAGANVVAYRELFINRKKSSVGSRKPTEKRKVASTKAVEKQQETRRAEPVVQSAAPLVSTPVSVPSAPMFTTESKQSAERDDDDYETKADEEEILSGDPYLEYFENGLVRRIRLKEGTTRVGSREKMVDYRINSDRVSKVHADFIRENGHFYVKDINSKNGTFINGSHERIVSNELVEISPGSHIRLSSEIEMVLKRYNKDER